MRFLLFMLLALSCEAQYLGLPPYGPNGNVPPYLDTTNLVAWYPLDVNGTTTPDVIGGNTGTFAGTPTTVTGKITNAVSFSAGTNFTSESIASNYFAGGTVMTIMGWVWVNNGATEQDNVAFNVAGNTGNYRFGFQFYDNATYLLCCNGSSAYYTAAALPLNQWVHIAMVYNGAGGPEGVWTFYTNGVQMKYTATNGTVATSIPSAANLPNFFCGMGSGITGTVTNDDIRLYNVAKTAAAVYYSYTNTSFIYQPPPQPPVTMFQSVVLAEPYVSNLWMFNNSSSESPLIDLVTSNQTAIPSGMTIGQAGAFANWPGTTSAGVTNCVMRLWSSTVANVEYTAPWTMEFIIEPIGIPSGFSANPYYLFSKLTGSFVGYSVNVGTEINSAFPTTRDGSQEAATSRLVAYSLIDDGSDAWEVGNTDNISSNTWHHVVMTYQYSNSLPYFRLWIDGAPSQMTTNQQSGPVPTTIINSIVPSILGSTNSSAHDFQGLVQAAAIYGTNLSDQKIVQHYLAYTGQPTNWNNSFFPSPLSLNGFTDTTGAPLHLQNANVLWVPASNNYFVSGFNLTNTDFPCSLTPFYDNTNNQYICYETPNLLTGTFTNMGVVLDDSGPLQNVIEMVRVSFLTNATSKYIAWGKMIQTNYVGANQHAFVATSTAPQGPFTIVTTNLVVNGNTSIGDCQLYQDPSGSQYFVYTLYSPESVSVTAISANGLTSSGSATVINNTGDGSGYYYEAPTMCKQGSTYFCFMSYQEFYNSVPHGATYAGMKDIVYYTASTPLGTWTSNGSIYISAGNPYGTPFECQGTQVFQPNNSTNFYLIGDNWHNGYLARSSLVVQLLMFPTSTTCQAAGSTNFLCTFQ